MDCLGVLLRLTIQLIALKIIQKGSHSSESFENKLLSSGSMRQWRSCLERSTKSSSCALNSYKQAICFILLALHMTFEMNILLYSETLLLDKLCVSSSTAEQHSSKIQNILIWCIEFKSLTELPCMRAAEERWPFSIIVEITF